MRPPREPGFYWVRVPSGRRIVVAEWSQDVAPNRWSLPGMPGGIEDREVTVVSPRISPPPSTLQ